MPCSRKLLASLAGAVLIVGCAAGVAACADDSGQSSDPEQAREVVSDAIRALGDGDYERVCELSSEHLNKVTERLTGADTCAQAYKALFAEGRNKYAEVVQTIQRYRAAAVDQPSGLDRTRVTLEGPQGKTAYSFLVDEGGEFKITDLFVPSNVAAGGGSSGG